MAKYNQFQDSYNKWIGIAFGDHGGVPLKAWLQGHLEKQPLEEFGFVRDWISAAAEAVLKEGLPGILLLIYVDALKAWLRCGCPSCQPDRGIRLARIWIAAQDAPGAGGCRVLFVDDRPPIRRLLETDTCFPTRPGCVNLAPYLWQPWDDDVKKKLEAAGVKLADTIETLKLDNLHNAQLDDILGGQQITSCDSKGNSVKIQPIVVNFNSLMGKRVVAFKVAG